MLEWMQQYSGALTFLATLVLVGITGFYAFWTRGILEATATNSRISLSPVIGIDIKEIEVGPYFAKDRRNMTADVTLTNLGNAPALEVFLDAEIMLRYSQIEGHSTIPMRSEPYLIPFLRPGENEHASPNFGDAFIAHFFDDLRESYRLNMHRITTGARGPSHPCSRLRIVAYYRNSLGQYFHSVFETEIGLFTRINEQPVPMGDEAIKVLTSREPRQLFKAELFDEERMNAEIAARNPLRRLCGW